MGISKPHILYTIEATLVFSEGSDDFSNYSPIKLPVLILKNFLIFYFYPCHPKYHIRLNLSFEKKDGMAKRKERGKKGVRIKYLFIRRTFIPPKIDKKNF